MVKYSLSKIITNASHELNSSRLFFILILFGFCLKLSAQGLRSPVPNPVQIDFAVEMRKVVAKTIPLITLRMFLKAGPEFSAFPLMFIPGFSCRTGIGAYIGNEKNYYTYGIGTAGFLNLTCNPLLYKKDLNRIDLLAGMGPIFEVYTGKKLKSGLIVELKGCFEIPWYASLVRCNALSRYTILRVSTSAVLPIGRCR